MAKKEWKNMSKREKVTGFIVLAVVVIVFVSIFSDDNKNTESPASSNTNNNTSNADAKPAVEAKKKPEVPAEYESALSQADSYANTMNMSKKGVYDQLVSEYGGKFSAPAAQYAIKNVKSDWNANALAKAKDYQDTMHMSPAAIRDQLTSSYGEKFTPAEADYAVAHLND